MGAQQLTVPGAVGAGSSSDVSSLGPGRTILVSGTFVGHVIVEASEDNSTWVQIAFFSQPGHQFLNISATYMRVNLVYYVSGTPVVYVSDVPINVNLVDASAANIGTYTNPITIKPGLSSKAAFGAQLVATEEILANITFHFNNNTDVMTATEANSGTVTNANSLASCNTSTNTAGSATLQSKRFSRYIPGRGLVARFSAIFTTGKANSYQEIGLGTANNGYFFGYNGATFGILHRNAGTDTWIPQDTWNVDVMDGTGLSGITLDPTKGNVFQVQMQYLGFGSIRFFVENGTTGEYVLVHTIVYPNLYTATSLGDPNLPLRMRAYNDGNDSNIVLSSGSMGLMSEGDGNHPGLHGGVSARRTGITTLVNVLTIRNKATYASKTNSIRVQVHHLSLALETNAKDAEFELVKNATLGGAPSYTDFSTNTSPVDYDVVGTTLTGGRTQFVTNIFGSRDKDVPLHDHDIFLEPGETITLAARSISGGTIVVSGGIVWHEEI